MTSFMLHHFIEGNRDSPCVRSIKLFVGTGGFACCELASCPQPQNNMAANVAAARIRMQAIITMQPIASVPAQVQLPYEATQSRAAFLRSVNEPSHFYNSGVQFLA